MNLGIHSPTLFIFVDLLQKLEHGNNSKPTVKENAILKGDKKIYAEIFFIGAVAILGSVAYGTMR